MNPTPGERLVRYVGDTLRFSLDWGQSLPIPKGWRAFLRTNLGRARRVREEILHSHFHRVPPAGESWHDIPMPVSGRAWTLDITLAEVGFFKAKTYAVDAQGHQHWPAGADFGVSIHPDISRTANTIYCAFTRQFGEARVLEQARDEELEERLRSLDAKGYTVIPPSGKLRDLTGQLPHIMGTLGFRILHLLPVNPTPTTMARFGRYGSPYACQDLLAIDPALVVFDRRTTGVDQFRELAYAVRERGGRLFLDVVINHTGWGATLQENHPEWYLRSPDGGFVSPGAWGVTWEDLSELEHKHPELWVHLSEVFLTWCRRGVDGFRCDAGYKVPLAAWQYIISRVRQEFPNTVFLLEGLGGPWATTEELLTEGGMQWAYSELFQNFTGRDIGHYLDYALQQSLRVGTYVHYSETHDNNRLAATGRTWSMLRNQLCALTSVSGGFGITSGVEWLAPEKINVHSCGGLNWDAPDNIVSALSQINRLLCDHPCFFDGAQLNRLSPGDSPVYALQRVSAAGEDQVLVLINTDAHHERHFSIPARIYSDLGEPHFELLGHGVPELDHHSPGNVTFRLLPASCVCLAGAPHPVGLQGDAYRQARARAAWAVQCVSAVHPILNLGACDWRAIAERVDRDPALLLSSSLRLERSTLERDVVEAVDHASDPQAYPAVVEWNWADLRRTTPVPPRHWLLIRDPHPFRASLAGAPGELSRNAESVATRHGHIAAFFLGNGKEQILSLKMERYGAPETHGTACILQLPSQPNPTRSGPVKRDDLALLTNGRGGMARLVASLGEIHSKYDCALGANLHPDVPADRHVFVKRLRMWVVADGFISALNGDSLVQFVAGPPARWMFDVNAGDGRKVRVELEADMLEGRNCTVFRLIRQPLASDADHPLPPHCEVTVTVRVDIEDRNFHSQTRHNEGADHHFSSHALPLSDRPGFRFDPGPDRVLHVYSTLGTYRHEAEWCTRIPHPVEESRGQEGSGDAFSPGWFSLPLQEAQSVHLVLTADATLPSPAVVEQFARDRHHRQEVVFQRSGISKSDKLGRALLQSTHAYVVRRGDHRTVVAGYPWFLDWGRDTLICARGLLAGGMVEEVRQLLQVFGRFESYGTIPNTIHGENASNRDTSDAPLWYGMVCEDLAVKSGRGIYQLAVDSTGRTVGSVLRSIATHYRDGTPNGIRMDPETGLIWSPTHFTWMDTNFPAGTPREGYPVEIQVLWIKLLHQVAQLEEPSAAREWRLLAQRAHDELLSRFWIEERGYLADLLIAAPGVSVRDAVVDSALRSNCLTAVCLGLVTGEKARRTVGAVLKHLVLPGALRSLAPQAVSPPLPVHGTDGRLLNDPEHPYWGRYAGDEDTSRKPAYHNGTAWTWTFPGFCEALALAWDRQPAAVEAARAYLGSVTGLLMHGCVGHLPEVVDGDHPHEHRGCDAQAWGATEALRVWRGV